MPGSYLYFYLFVFKYFNYLYIKNTKLLLKKNPLPHVKTTHSHREIFMVFFFFFLNSLKNSKIFVIQILYSYHNQYSSILTYIDFHVFCRVPIWGVSFTVDVSKPKPNRPNTMNLVEKRA